MLELKNSFRKRNAALPYKHSELDQSPIERLQDETRIEFDEARLPTSQKAAFKKMYHEVVKK